MSFHPNLVAVVKRRSMFDLFPGKQFFRVNPTGVRLWRTSLMAIVLPLFLFGIREPLSQARMLQEKEFPLVYGAPIEREMAGGQSHRYLINLTGGSYVHLVVEQRGIDVVVTLSEADGAKLLTMDTPNGTMG